MSASQTTLGNLIESSDLNGRYFAWSALRRNTLGGIKISNVRHLLGVARWPDVCACCAKASKTRIPLDTLRKSSVEMIPFCTVCERHPDFKLTNPSEVHDLLSDSDVESAWNKTFVPSAVPRPARIRRSCTAISITYTSEMKRIWIGTAPTPVFSPDGIQFVNAVAFNSVPIPSFMFSNFDYAKRFAEENGLNWEEIIKENESPPESSEFLHLLKLLGVFLIAALLLFGAMYLIKFFLS
jgi:hypothetical protein